jgi:hypothetical protein
MAARLADYLDVPLRYPLHCAASASAVLEAPPPAGTYQCAATGLLGPEEQEGSRVASVAGWGPECGVELAIGAGGCLEFALLHPGPRRLPCHRATALAVARSLSVVCSWPSGRAALVAGTNRRFAPPVRRVGAWGSTAMGDAVVPPSPAWPLYYDGDRRTRFAYAIFALNKVGLRTSGLTTKTACAPL